MTNPGRRAIGIVFVLALALYAASAGNRLARGSLAPHYVYLAYAMLHGRLNLDPLPPTTYDLLLYQGRWYVAGSPLPAVLMAPQVVLGGLAASDVLFGVVVGAINVALIYDLVGQLDAPPVSEATRRWLAALFAAGTAHGYVSSLGSVWFNAHAVTVLFVTLYARETLTRGRGGRAGVWLALAALARPTVICSAAFFVAYAAGQAGDWRRALRRVAPFVLALGCGAGALLAYNAARFGHALDFGYAYVQGADNLTSTYARWGGFNLRYMPCNVYVSLAGLPDSLGHFSPITARLCSHLLPDGPLPVGHPWLAPNPVGMSVFLVTPALLYIFRARGGAPAVRAAWLALVAVALPLWLYHNTGSLQFGYRYSLDAAPFWMLLTAAGMAGRSGRLERGVILLSIAIHLAGLAWMFNALTGSAWPGW